MKLSEIIKLLGAGYTKAEIQAMGDAQEEQTEETSTEPSTEQTTQNSPEPNTAQLQAIIEEQSRQITELTNSIQSLNITFGRQPETEETTAEDILSQMLGGN